MSGGRLFCASEIFVFAFLFVLLFVLEFFVGRCITALSVAVFENLGFLPSFLEKDGVLASFELLEEAEFIVFA